MKRKGLSMLLSALLVMVLAVSFSAPVEAASWTYVTGDAVGTINNFTGGSFALSYKDGSFSPMAPYATSEYTSFSGHSYFRVSYLDYYFTSTIPAGSRVCLEFGFRVWCQTASGSNVTSVLYDGLDYSMNNPLLDNVQVSVVQNQMTGAFDRGFYGQIMFDTSVPVKMVNISDLTVWFNVSSSSASNKCYVYPYNFRVSYYPINDNPNGDVLNQIKTNTANTNNSINNQTNSINNNITNNITNQTNTLTDGYDNAGMESSNTALSGSMNDYAAVEDQAVDQSVSYIDDVGFVSPASNSSVFAAITFTSSWLQSLFVNMGDWSLLILVSLSLSLGLMLIGWFKYR